MATRRPSGDRPKVSAGRLRVEAGEATTGARRVAVGVEVLYEEAGDGLPGQAEVEDLSKGGNSGIMYGVVEAEKYDAAWKTGPEYQLIDDVGFPEKLEEWQKAGANYAMHLPNAEKRLKPVGEWNNSRIVVNGTHVEHWLNGRKILEFERWTPEWRKLRDSGKWKDAPDYGLAKTGRIVLQDHGSGFWFRNIKLRPLR